MSSFHLEWINFHKHMWNISTPLKVKPILWENTFWYADKVFNNNGKQFWSNWSKNAGFQSQVYVADIDQKTEANGGCGGKSSQIDILFHKSGTTCGVQWSEEPTSLSLYHALAMFWQPPTFWNFTHSPSSISDGFWMGGRLNRTPSLLFSFWYWTTVIFFVFVL